MNDPSYDNALNELRRLQDQAAELAHNNELLRQQIAREREEHHQNLTLHRKAFNPEELERRQKEVERKQKALDTRNQELEAFIEEVASGRTKFAAQAKILLR